MTFIYSRNQDSSLFKVMVSSNLDVVLGSSDFVRRVLLRVSTCVRFCLLLLRIMLPKESLIGDFSAQNCALKWSVSECSEVRCFNFQPIFDALHGSPEFDARSSDSQIPSRFWPCPHRTHQRGLSFIVWRNGLPSDASHVLTLLALSAGIESCSAKSTARSRGWTRR